MNNVSSGFVQYTFLFFLGFSFINPSWSANNSAIKSEINTGIKVNKISPRCPPFGVGDTWTMRRTNTMANGFGSKTDFTITITSVNSNTVKMESVEPGGSRIQSELRRKRGMFYPVKDTIGNIEIFYVSNTTFCPPPAVGQSIVGHGHMNGVKVGTQTTTVKAIDPYFIKVSVPAGTFITRKILTRVKASGPQASPPYTITHYYADGIGAVKEVFRFADGSVQVHELLKYKF